jgi:hypothetical protein
MRARIEDGHFPQRRAIRVFSAVVAAALGLGSVALIGPSAVAATTVTFTTAGEHVYVVPAGVTAIRIDAIGGKGTDGNGAGAGKGGQGGRVVAVYQTTPGTRLIVEVGQNGAGRSTGGGGTSGGFDGGRGGGASDVRLCTIDDCPEEDTRILVAGGGGGGGAPGVAAQGSGAVGTKAGGAGGDAGKPGGQGDASGLDLTRAGGGAGGSLSANLGGHGSAGVTCEALFPGGIGGNGRTVEGQGGQSNEVRRGGSGGAAFGGAGGGGVGVAGGGGGGGGGAGFAGGGGGGGGGHGSCGSSDYSSGGGGGGGGSNYVGPALRTITNGVSTSNAPQVTITTLDDQTIQFTSAAPTDAKPGGAYRPTATATSGLPVTLSVDPSSGRACRMTVVSGFQVVVFGDPGVCVVNANQPGNNSWNPAPQVRQSSIVHGTKQPQTIAFTSVPPGQVAIGDVYTPAAQATSGLPVAFSITGSAGAVCDLDTGVVTFLTAGDCVINADQPGDDAWSAAPRVQQIITAGKSAQLVTFTSTPPADPIIGDTYTPAATATSGLPVAFSIAAGSATICQLDGGVVTFIGRGQCLIDANQPGDTEWSPAPPVQQSVAVRQSQSITFTSTAPAGPIAGDTYTPVATATSGLPVDLSIAAASSAVCDLINGVVTFVAGGECVIDANQPGDAEWLPAPQVQQSLTIGKQSQFITLTSTPPTDPIVGGTYDPVATATSGLPVVFSIPSGSSAVCSLNSGVVTFLTGGVCVIDANQPGDAEWSPASRVRLSIAVRQPQSITFTSAPPGSAAVGGTYTPTATASSGLSVSISIESSSTAICALQAGVVTFLGDGVCLLDADQSGDALWAPAPRVQQRVPVGAAQAAPVIGAVTPPTLTVSKSSSVVITAAGSPLPIITIVGALPAGVTFSDHHDGTAALSGAPAPGSAGSYAITIRAQTSAGTSEQQVTLVVARIPSAVKLTLPDSAIEGRSVTIGIEVTGGDPPSGIVELSAGTVILGTATLDAAGRGQLSTLALPVGAQTIQARYAGDGTFAPAVGTATISVAAGNGLASTGTEATGLLAASLAFLGVGGALLLLLVRRRRAES